MTRWCLAILLLVCASTSLVWVFMSPRLAQYPLKPAVVTATEKFKGWTINSEPVGSELSFHPGERLSFAVQLEDDPKAPQKVPFRRQVNPDYSKVHPELAFRFVEQVPRDDSETYHISSTLYRKHRKVRNDPYICNWRAPKRRGDYQLQLVLYHTRLGDFPIRPSIGGDVICTARVHITD